MMTIMLSLDIPAMVGATATTAIIAESVATKSSGSPVIVVF